MSKPQVFMTKDISAKGILAAYKALQRPAKGKVAIKLHMGEPGNKNFLSPDLVRDLQKEVNGAFVDSNTYYEGLRSKTEDHIKAANDHGFGYAPIDILDADGDFELPVKDGKQLKNAIIGSHYKDYDFFVSVAHFKGHQIAGFGGTFKNLAVGMASPRGKGILHGLPGEPWSSEGEEFFEKVVEYTKAVKDDKGENILYINILNNLSVDCDCDGGAAAPEMADIGVLASLDPVALDKASVDLVYNSPDEGKKALIERIESRGAIYTLQYAESIGVGSQAYDLVSID